jgi:hypothetical protein
MLDPSKDALDEFSPTLRKELRRRPAAQYWQGRSEPVRSFLLITKNG